MAIILVVIVVCEMVVVGITEIVLCFITNFSKNWGKLSGLGCMIEVVLIIVVVVVVTFCLCLVCVITEVGMCY
jgi:hypothetical protein